MTRPPLDGPWTNAPYECCFTLSDEEHTVECRKVGGVLRENAVHLARHLADICDALDAGEPVRPHIHLASAFLLSLLREHSA